MKTWFPFTDYDFYAYLTSGSLLIASTDLAFNAGLILATTNWSFVSIVLFFAGAYVVGHLVAFASSQLLEFGLARTLIAPPVEILLGRKTPSALERFAGTIIGRYYEPLTEPVREKVLAVAAALLQRPSSALSAEDVFQVAHRTALATDHLRDRVSDFRNQYGFCRNVALVAIVATILFAMSSLSGKPALWSWAAIGMVVAFGMTVRFLKFYAAFSAEVLRALIK